MKLLKNKRACLAVVTGMMVLGMNTTAFAAPVKEGETYTLTVLHTNDIHGNVENLPKYSTIINQVRSEAQNVLLLDGGDIFLRGEFEEYQGQVEMEILNEIGYDAWVLGNNDFRIGPSGGTIAQGNEQLQDRIAQAEFPTICANVTQKTDGGLIENVEPYIIKEVNGVDVGIIGVTSLKPQNRNWEEVSDKVFESGDETVKKLIAEVNGKSDISLVLSHTGIGIDLNIAGIEGVDAVLGADDHYLLKEPIYTTYLGQKSTPITQAGGEDNHHLGRLDLIFQNEGGEMKLVDFSGKLYDLDLVKEDTGVRAIIEKYRGMQEGKTAA